jgi:tetratricopeptide (TPR) repeat protein
MSSNGPDAGCTEMDGGAQVASGFVVGCSNGAEQFESGKEAPCQMPCLQYPLGSMRRILTTISCLLVSCLLVLFLATAPLFSQADLRSQEEIQTHTRLAKQFLREGKPELAVPELRAITVLDPTNVDARGNLGVLLFFSGEYAEAIPQLRAALVLQPDLWKIQASLGFAEEQIGKQSEARKDLESAFSHLQDEKIKAKVGDDLIASYSSTGDLDKAAATVSEMLRIRKEDVRLLYTAYRLYSNLADQTMLTLAVAAPNSAQLHQVIAHEQATHTDPAMGIDKFRKTLETNPQLQDPDLDSSAATASAELQLNPTDAGLLYKADRLYSGLAEQALLNLMTRWPDSAQMYSAMANVLAKRGYPEAAIEDERKALQLDPTIPGLHFELGEMLSNSPNSTLQEEAQAEFKAALAANPSDEKAELSLGDIAAKHGDLKTAYADYSHALELQPNDPEANMDLANILISMGQRAKALPYMESSVHLDPTNAVMHYKLSQLYRDVSRPEDAQRELEQYKIYKNMKDKLSASLKNLRAEEAQEKTPVSDVIGGGTERIKYVGDAACASCHKDQSNSFSLTSHHLTSQLPTEASILGSFSDGSNTLKITSSSLTSMDSTLSFLMEARADGYYETAITGRDPHIQTQSERIDIVTGSGRHGQSYLYWQGDKLYELPVSYWSESGRWINSPGYKNGTANFSRPMTPRCMECHATYIKPLSSDPGTNRYLKDSLQVGISCETCHGPGADHIMEQKVRTGGSGRSILNPVKFSRDRQVDLCALCHNGTLREETAPAFSYKPGEPLDRYFTADLPNTEEHPDVHGNQVGLLKRSRCYISSPNMTCTTCHDVHAPERSAAAYSARCLSCHQVAKLRHPGKDESKIVNNCIDCHMPKEQTKLIVSETAGQTVRATMRNHWIKIYPQ